MQITLVPATIPAPSAEGRTAGIHVSKVIRAIAIEAKILDRKYASNLDLIELGSGIESGWWESLDPVAQIRIAIGMAWEEWYLPKLEGMVYHPGELQLQGIYMTHDGESLDYVYASPELGEDGDLILAVHECKTTSKSTRTVGDLSSQWMWLAQIQAYCKALGARRAYVHVLFLCGDYKYPIQPSLGPHREMPQLWRVDFTQDELDANWDLLTEYVKARHALDQKES